MCFEPNLCYLIEFEAAKIIIERNSSDHFRTWLHPLLALIKPNLRFHEHYPVKYNYV